MKNFEKYLDRILSVACENLGVDETDNSVKPCSSLDCSNCLFYEDGGGCCSTFTTFNDWCREEYEEPQIDPRINNKTPIDTKILVSSNGTTWYKRHFYRKVDGLVVAFANGNTSFTSEQNDSSKVAWKYAKLYEG